MSSSKPAGQGASGHWSDGETTALVLAWGQLYLQRKRLSDAEWREVCGAVNAHRAAAGHRFDRSVVQCQGRLSSLKSQYKKELTKNGPSGWRHFAQIHSFLAGPDDGPPPCFTAKMSSATVKDEEMVEEEASGSVGRKTVQAKRKFSGLQDILDRSGGPPPGFPAGPGMPPTAKKEDDVKEEEVGGEGPAYGPVSAECLPGAVVTKLAEVYCSVEMERLSMEKQKMAMERERSAAAKVEAENLGETHDN